MFMLGAFYTNGDFGGADTYLDAVADASTFTQGTVMRIPPGRDNLLGEALTTAAATFSYARIETPSIRPLSNQYLTQYATGQADLNEKRLQFHPRSPRQLQVAEQMQFLVNTDDAGAQDHYGLVWLGDGPQQPIEGQFFTTRLTSTVQQAVGVWREGPVVFEEQLPVTSYQVVGMSVLSASGVAARLIFSDSQIRPGRPIYNGSTGFESNRFRYGNMGVWGSFDINQPPRIELLGGVAASQTIYLDCVRTG